MKKVFTLVFIAGALCSLQTVKAQKIGVVSPDEIFALMPETKKADTVLAQYQNALAESYQEQQAELNDAYAKFVKDSGTMKPAVKEVKRKELQTKIADMQTKEQDMTKDLEAKKEEILKPIREKMLKYIKDVAKENNYTFILYKEQTIISPDADDITDKVKAKLGLKGR
jgi:outer membrane protein